MPEIPAGIIVLWPGNDDAWPSGWSRVTSLDGKFAKGTTGSPAPTGTGGSSTHTHPSPAHDHTTGSHSHTACFSAGPGHPYYPGLQIPATACAATVYGVQESHTHSGNSNSVSGGTSGSAAGSFASQTNKPLHYTMIAIQSDGNPEGFPNNSVVYYNGSVPSDWGHHSGSASRFIMGAATDGNGGSQVSGGSHTHPGSGHTHPAASAHTHPAPTDLAGTVYGTPGTRNSCCTGHTAFSSSANSNHHHPWKACTSAVGSATSASSPASGGHDYLPPFTYLRAIQNTSGADNWLEEAIVLWVGSIANIPDDWTLCDGGNNDSGNATPSLNGKFIMTTNSGGSSLNSSAGTAGHDHTDPGTHVHPQTHTHLTSYPGWSASGSWPQNRRRTENSAPGGSYPQFNGHTGHPMIAWQHWHDGVTTTASNTEYGAGAHTVDAVSNNEPEYVVVAYLSAPAEPSAGGFGLYGANF